MITKNLQKGFTLLEILIAMILLTVISVVISGSLAPWLNFKQKLDTERKLVDIRTSVELAYSANAMRVEGSAQPELALSTGSVKASVPAAGQCAADEASWQSLASFLPEGVQTAMNDGFGNPWCVFITPQLTGTVNGTTVYYHNVAVVSLGRQGQLAEGTHVDSVTGALTLDGDNMGTLINGYAIQKAKLEQTQARMDKLASLYETYFTTQYLANPSRDITVDYFAFNNPTGNWDANSDPLKTVQGTQGVGAPALGALAILGVGPIEATSAYESQNQIQLENYAACFGGACVRSAANGGPPPYTALLYTPLPGPAGTHLVKSVTGNY